MTADPPVPDFASMFLTTERDSAAAFGNAGVTVVGTPALIGVLETAAARCAAPLLEAGEATVGTMVNIRHLAAAPTGARIEARARLSGREGRRLTFEVDLRWGEVLLMSGTHERAVVDLARFLARLPAAPGGEA